MIITAPFSAVMLVGAFVSVEVAGGNTEAFDEPRPIEPVHTHSSTAGTINYVKAAGGVAGAAALGAQ